MLRLENQHKVTAIYYRACVRKKRERSQPPPPQSLLFVPGWRLEGAQCNDLLRSTAHSYFRQWMGLWNKCCPGIGGPGVLPGSQSLCTDCLCVWRKKWRTRAVCQEFRRGSSPHCPSSSVSHGWWLSEPCNGFPKAEKGSGWKVMWKAVCPC